MKTRTHPITCDGPCGSSQVLGTVELPADATQDDIARATSGYLCESDCGPAYRHGVAHGHLAPGRSPSKEHVARYHQDLADATKALRQAQKDAP